MTIKRIIIVLISVLVVAASMGTGFIIAKKTGQKSENIAESTQQTSASELSGETEASDEPSTTVLQSGSESSNSEKTLLLGMWTDNANFSGYEFFEDGTMKVTYFNMSLLNLDDIIDGTYTGTYKIDGDKLIIYYTIYSKAVEKTYTFSVDEKTLTLKEGGDEAVYVRKGAETAMESVDKALLGKWKSNLSGYEFKDTGIVTITYINLESMGIKLPISGTADGVYTLNGDEVTIKYSIYSGVIEKTYKYSIDGNILTMTEKGTSDTGTYIKEK